MGIRRARRGPSLVLVIICSARRATFTISRFGALSKDTKLAGGDTNWAAIAFDDSRRVYCSSTHANTRYNTTSSVVVVVSSDEDVESMRILWDRGRY